MFPKYHKCLCVTVYISNVNAPHEISSELHIVTVLARLVRTTPPSQARLVLTVTTCLGLHGKLVDNFSHESDVTSLQDAFTSRS